MGWGILGVPGIWLDPGGIGEEVAEAEFQAGGGLEGWVVYAPVDPRIFFRPGAVGRGWLCRGQAHDGLQNNLIVGGWGIRSGHPDALCRGNGGPFRGSLVIYRGVLPLLSADVTEAATEAQGGHDDQ